MTITNDNPYATLGTRNAVTPQREQARPDQVKNNAGGFVFQVSDAQALRRFLVLGTEGGTYYANQRDHTKQAAAVVQKMSDAGDMALIDTILDVSLNGLAPKQSATLLALAVAVSSPDDKLRAAALNAVPKVCRTFTMLAEFLGYAKNFRGMGRGLRKAVGSFYSDRDVDDLALQIVKYRNREGWTHSDVLRVAHPSAPTEGHKALYDYASGRVSTSDEVQLAEIVKAFDEINSDSMTPQAAAAIIESARLPWEAVPDALLNEPLVLEALLPHMGATALLRQLPRFARAGLTEGSFGGSAIAAKLTDLEFIKRGRLHPYNVLVAQMTYASGKSLKGSSEWTPSRKIIEALEDTFELSFQAIEPAGKNTGVFLDVSGSMGWSNIANSPITPRVGSAAMAMATVRSEPNVVVGAFTGGAYHGRMYGTQHQPISLLDIGKRHSLSQVMTAVDGLPMGPTDCALPMVWAKTNEPTIETFIVYTDNETWSGTIQPQQALRDYRRATGIDAKLVVVGMTATSFSIADPTDSGMMDVCGFDSSAPRVMADFSAGRI